jgi:cholesterol transport system auxiliary component
VSSVALGKDTENEQKLLFLNRVKKINLSASVPRTASRLLLLALLGLLSGCLSRPQLHTQTFAFDPPADSIWKSAAQSARVVSIRSLRVAAPFDDRSLVYRTGDFSYVEDPYAEFLVSPSESLRPPIRSWMVQSDLFQDVVEAGSALKPNTMVEITVLELYGDFRPGTKPEAVLTLRFVLLESPNGIPGKLEFQGEYSRRVLLKARNAKALMAGWNEALEQILVQLGSQVGRLDLAPAYSGLTKDTRD